MPMMEIDARLLDPNGEPELIENFNRVMQAVDNAGGEGVPGPQGPAGPTYTLPAATTGALGGVRKSAAVAKAAADTVTQAEFNALIDALVAAGITEAGA